MKTFTNRQGTLNFALYFQQLQDTGNDRRVTPVAEEISKEEFENVLKSASLKTNNLAEIEYYKAQNEVKNGTIVH